MKNIFFGSLGRFADKTAFIAESGEEVSYSDLLSRADRVASFADPRDIVFLVCRNDAESIAAYVGFLRRGVVPVMISDAVNAESLGSLKDAYRPSYIFLPTSDAAPGCEVVCGHGDYSLVRTGCGKDYTVGPDLALLLTTSGSTGSPKLVRQTYENIESNTASIMEYLGIKPEDRAVTTLPMSYTYGISIINTHLSAGAALILSNGTLMDRGFWNALKTHKATTFGGVPYTYEMLKKLRFERMELPHLRYLTQAGGKLSAELCAEFVGICGRKGMEFIVMYGQTEATARMSYLPWKHAYTKAGSIGIAIPGGELWLVGDDGLRIESPQVVGELIYRGRNVTPGYAENRFDLRNGDERDGVLETGDMAYFDEDGFYYIAGRKKRFLKIYGNRVNLDEVEGLLKRAGFDCAVAGTDDDMRIYMAGDAEDARQYVLRSTGINPAGFAVATIDAIPRNSSGKVLYSELIDG
ncbi:MAG: AMP-binding protein [Synergistaceae bacterium]|jgi:acyl-CoA synthetase (AMP-forming)/AMP-acid ligase II|nr:AMP-binding protein [Synergistaceae bacterium]